VEVVPTNDEFTDKQNSKAVKLLIKHLWYINDVDFLLQRVHRQRIIFGSSFLGIDWNPEIGDLHPEHKRNKESDKIRVGDVEYSLKLPWNILPELVEDWSKQQTLIEKELCHLEELKDQYPEKAQELRLNKKSTSFSLNSLKQEPTGNYVWKYTLYQKDSKHFPEGRRIVFTIDSILEDKELGLSHGGFPVLRITDIDIPGQLQSMSRYQQVLPLQNSHNHLSQSIMKNEFLMSAPKWMMPKGAANIQSLGNGRTIVQYQGPVPPQLVQMNPTSATTFGFRDKIESEIGSMMAVHPISSGQPPQGITAAVALQFLNEQENERNISDIAKHNNFLVELAKHTIAVAGDYYQPDDGRMLRIMGKENKHLIKFFDNAALHKDYDVRIQNSSALPQSKAARMERILQTMQFAPDILPAERWVELLDFGSVEKMNTLITESIQAAESEEEDMLEGIPVEEPKEWEDHISHLQVHYRKVQSRSFKEEVPVEIQALLITHIKVTEMLAAKKAQESPLFAAKLAQLTLFPMFWKHDPHPLSRQQQEVEAQAQANQGQPVTAKIPGEEKDVI
jgi:hypothetical protein